MCLNPRCGNVFHSYEKANPPCPKCHCVRVGWVPGGGHIAKSSPQADRTLKSLSADYGMGNINSGSPSRLNRAMPKYDHAPADGPVLNFGPGFSAPTNRSGRATCGTSVNNVNFRTTVAAEKAMTSSRSYPQIGRDHWTGIRTRYRP